MIEKLNQEINRLCGELAAFRHIINGTASTARKRDALEQITALENLIDSNIDELVKLQANAKT